MSAIGFSFDKPRAIISAHADYDRSHFIFPRTQSEKFRGTPWGRRAKPQKSWGEICLYASTALAGLIAMSTIV
jgi:hypothetical protein